MKKLVSLLFLMFVTGITQATIINVDNNLARPSGYYANLQLAVNAAQEGDTLYVYPSNTSYGDVIIKKTLHLFGKGYNGTTGFVSRINYLRLDTNTSPSTNSSGSSFQGLTIKTLTCSKPNIVNIVAVGNYFYYSNTCINLNGNCSGWLIANNYIKGYINVADNGSLIISNNIFYGYQYGSSQLFNSSSNSVLFSHNLVLNFKNFTSVYNTTIIDNIFIAQSSAAANSTMANNNFINNLSWRSTLNPYLLPPDGNQGSGNLSNQDPQFETAPSSGTFDQSKDYHLKSTSSGKNAASDGTDIGPYGGSSPFVWGGTFSIPKITESLITNPVINQSTPINVNVKAKKAEL